MEIQSKAKKQKQMEFHIQNIPVLPERVPMRMMVMPVMMMMSCCHMTLMMKRKGIATPILLSIYATA